MPSEEESGNIPPSEAGSSPSESGNSPSEFRNAPSEYVSAPSISCGPLGGILLLSVQRSWTFVQAQSSESTQEEGLQSTESRTTVSKREKGEGVRVRVNGEG